MVTPKIIPNPRASIAGTREWREQRERDLAAKRITELTGKRLADERILQRMEQRKKALALGLEKGVATFANEERRRYFYDDEDFEDLIDTDEDDDLVQVDARAYASK